jgi:hypothetical protein
MSIKGKPINNQLIKYKSIIKIASNYETKQFIYDKNGRIITDTAAIKNIILN